MARERNAAAAATTSTEERDSEFVDTPRPHQSGGEGREGRSPLRLCRAGRDRRPEGPGRVRPRQGARSPRGDPQGDRCRQARPDRACRCAKAARCITTSRPAWRRPGVLRPAPAGTGIIAGGPMRAVFESLGVHDVVAKSQGSSNPYNMIRATFDALSREDCPRRSRSAATLRCRPCSRVARASSPTPPTRKAG